MTLKVFSSVLVVAVAAKRVIGVFENGSEEKQG